VSGPGIDETEVSGAKEGDGDPELLDKIEALADQEIGQEHHRRRLALSQNARHRRRQIVEGGDVRPEVEEAGEKRKGGDGGEFPPARPERRPVGAPAHRESDEEKHHRLPEATFEPRHALGRTERLVIKAVHQDPEPAPEKTGAEIPLRLFLAGTASFGSRLALGVINDQADAEEHHGEACDLDRGHRPAVAQGRDEVHDRRRRNDRDREVCSPGMDAFVESEAGDGERNADPDDAPGRRLEAAAQDSHRDHCRHCAAQDHQLAGRKFTLEPLNQRQADPVAQPDSQYSDESEEKTSVSHGPPPFLIRWIFFREYPLELPESLK